MNNISSLPYFAVPFGAVVILKYRSNEDST